MQMNFQMEEMHRAGHVGRVVCVHALSLPSPTSQHLHVEAPCTLRFGGF